MNSLAFATISDLVEKIDSKELSYEEVLEYFLERLERYDDTVKSTLEVFDRDTVLNSCCVKGELRGVPGLIKDNICQEGRIASCGSKILERFVSPYDATVCARLKEQGALLVGRANLDEFAMGSSGETSAFQKTTNPWNVACVPGGSSGGSAAAVAAGLVPWALGSETGGSVRQPAAFCGLVGIKPTYGLVSRYGLVAYASSLDQIGVFTRTVADNARVFSTIAGHDLRDSSSLFVEKKNYGHGMDGTLKEGLKIGIVDNALNAEGVNAEIQEKIEEAIAVFENNGASISRITLPTLRYATGAYFILSRAEAASNLARFDGVRYGLRVASNGLKNMYKETRHDGFGKEVQCRILMGNYVLASGHSGKFYDNARKVQRLIRREFKEAFKDVDILLAPTTPNVAFKFGAFDDNKLEMDLQDLFTAPVNLAGIPGLNIPCGFNRAGMPIGFQLIGPHLSEGQLYKTAYMYEQETQWYQYTPRGFER